MRPSPIRSFLAFIFFAMAFIGPIIFGMMGFIFSYWYFANHGLDGVHAIKVTNYFYMVMYIIPLVFIKGLASFAGFIGLFLGWVPGYMGLSWLEKNDDYLWG